MVPRVMTIKWVNVKRVWSIPHRDMYDTDQTVLWMFARYRRHSYDRSSPHTEGSTRREAYEGVGMAEARTSLVGTKSCRATTQLL